MVVGFDAAQGDVGNVRYLAPTPTIGTVGAPSHPTPVPVLLPEKGMDLSPGDFEWVTTEVLRVADLCCAGRVVSCM